MPPGCFNVTLCGSREATPALLRLLAELSRYAHNVNITPRLFCHMYMHMCMCIHVMESLEKPRKTGFATSLHSYRSSIPLATPWDKPGASSHNTGRSQCNFFSIRAATANSGALHQAVEVLRRRYASTSPRTVPARLPLRPCGSWRNLSRCAHNVITPHFATSRARLEPSR